MGYGQWGVATRLAQMLAALERAHVELLVDIRISPCPSQIAEHPTYGPRPWNLQAGRQGLSSALSAAGIGYLWLVELGNPQKVDPQMRVLREHLAAPDAGWPVHRGLRILEDLIVGDSRRCCLLCACQHYEKCHRKLIAEALAARIDGLELHDLS